MEKICRTIGPGTGGTFTQTVRLSNTPVPHAFRYSTVSYDSTFRALVQSNLSHFFLNPSTRPSCPVHLPIRPQILLSISKSPPPTTLLTHISPFPHRSSSSTKCPIPPSRLNHTWK